MKKEDFKYQRDLNSEVSVLLKVISNLYLNGGGLFYSFDIVNKQVLENLKENNSSNIEKILQNRIILEALTELQVEAPFQVKLNFQIKTLEQFELDLTEFLQNGGAYTQYEGDREELKNIIKGFCSSLFGNHSNEVNVYYTSQPWTDWFGELGFDATWIFIDKSKKKLYLLCITDMD
ncbi:hypothetical protein Q3A90_18065 [Priestia megaterium]|uniref:hypothetical protein n=1 Tax=Priestia megaterium TaxID=1404 RepID=UPI002674531C|nr:hypothetical protein [Priestia megaterium]WKU21675.1 hypothetical protein Q3A90_18065 [Priestia megaterium]